MGKSELSNLVSYGWNTNGQLGLGHQIEQITPQTVPNFANRPIKQVTCGSRFTAVVTATGALFTFGLNDQGQLGHGNQRSKLSPKRVEFFESDQVLQVSTRGAHVIALTVNGDIYAWGRAEERQLGLPECAPSSKNFSPCKIPFTSHVSITRVACGRLHSVAVTTSGRIYAWGSNEDGICGFGPEVLEAPRPTLIDHSFFDNERCLEVGCGSRHTIVLTEDGHCYSWGFGSYGQLGHGRRTNSSVPEKIQGLDGMLVRQIACGYRHSLAVVGNESNIIAGCVGHQVWAWGWNQYGQLGTGRASGSIAVPELVLLPEACKRVTVIAAGGRHSVCAVLFCKNDQLHHARATNLDTRNRGAAVFAWGRGDDGQLGVDAIGNTAMPKQVESLTGLHVEAMGCGWAHTCIALAGVSGYSKSSSHTNKWQLGTIKVGERVPSFTDLMKITPGDIDGFFGQMLNSLIQFLVMFQTCPKFCGLGIAFICQRLIPSVAVTILVGNLLFAAQGLRLARKERRYNVTGQPHGVNTVVFFAYVFLVMAPEFDRTKSPTDALKAGIFASFATGVLQLCMVPWIKIFERLVPRSALMAAVASVSLTFLSMAFAVQIYSNPGIALFPLMFILIYYASGLKLPFKIPAAMMALVIGTIVAWTSYLVGGTLFKPLDVSFEFAVQLPFPQPTLLWESLVNGNGVRYLSVILPMAVVTVAGNVAVVHTAATVGDAYSVSSSMVADSFVTMIGALFGNPFPCGLFIGHPAFKNMGARNGYLVVNALGVFLVALLNIAVIFVRFVPLPAGLGLLLWVGLVLTSEAFKEDPRSRHNYSTAVALGLLPSLAAWALQYVKSIANTTSKLTTELAPDSNVLKLSDILLAMKQGQQDPTGLIALAQGYLLSTLFLTSTVVHIIERRFLSAAVWMAIASILAFTGVVHSFSIHDTRIDNLFGFPAGGWGGLSVQFASGYASVSLLLILLHWSYEEGSLSRVCNISSILPCRYIWRRGKLPQEPSDEGTPLI